MDLMHTIGAIAWDPEIRNILALLVGVGVLVGSVYLLLGTNSGARLGLLITLASLFGWMMILGIMWWMYGIGMKGEASHWEAVEVVREDDPAGPSIEEVRTLPLPDELPDPADIVADDPELAAEFEDRTPTLGDVIESQPSLRDELGIDEQTGGWELLITSDPQRGDAAATADAALTGDDAPFQSSADYLVLDVYSRGGKPRLEAGADTVERVKHKLLSIWHWRHPTHYAVVQVQAVIPQEPEAGEAPPPPEVNPREPVFSVVMVRDLGDLRFPAAMVTIIFGILFGLTCWRLHERDKLVARNRSAAVA